HDIWSRRRKTFFHCNPNSIVLAIFFLFPFSAHFGRFVCPNCNKRYKWSSCLSRHLKHECGKEPKFQCEFCSKKFSQKSNLKSHVALKHLPISSRLMCFILTDKRFVCECGNRYRYRSGLYRHKNYECGKEPQFSCAFCSKRFKQKPNLKIHLASMHNAKLHHSYIK
ncbi:zinc finger protein 75A-like, partial [Cimex lectularius]|uniref:C2H2-type domain-containing protein n=1 Tax=Cimex lectularius TaxID=79782 RepID=A0A8I6SGC0_CIMLE